MEMGVSLVLVYTFESKAHIPCVEIQCTLESLDPLDYMACWNPGGDLEECVCLKSLGLLKRKCGLLTLCLHFVCPPDQ